MFKKTVTADSDFYTMTLLIVLLFAATLRYPYIFVTSIWSDEALYCWLGKQLFLHPSSIFSIEFTSWHPPLFSVFLALAHLALPSYWACHSVPFLFYLAGIIAIYYLGKSLSNPFVGVFAAILLAFNYYYFYYSTLVLIDVPLMVFCTILGIFLFQIEEKSLLRKHIIVGIWAALTILLKWSGIMVIPWILLFYLSSLQQLPFKKRVYKFLVPFFIIFIVILLLSIKNYYQLGQIQPYGPPINGFGYEIFCDNLKKLFSLIHPVFLIFFVIGLWDLLMRKKKTGILLLSWTITFMLCIFSIGTDIEQRFNILVLPSILITTGIGINTVLYPFSQKLFHLKSFVLLLTIIFSLRILNASPIKIDNSYWFYTGYEMAGSFIQKVDTKDTLVLAGSERQIRYFSGIDLKEYGGQIVEFRQSLTQFRKLIHQIPGPIILEFDIWEKLQPRWIFSQMAKKELTQDRFKLAKVVYFGQKKIFPIIFIYERLGSKL